MTYAAAPLMLNGSTLPNPNAVEETPSQEGDEIRLANGSLRRYDLGERLAVTLSWRNLTETELVTVRTAARRGVLAYVHEDGVTYAVYVDRPTVRPVAGTDPVRFDVELALREQTPRR